MEDSNIDEVFLSRQHSERNNDPLESHEEALSAVAEVLSTPVDFNQKREKTEPDGEDHHEDEQRGREIKRQKIEESESASQRDSGEKDESAASTATTEENDEAKMPDPTDSLAMSDTHARLIQQAHQQLEKQQAQQQTQPPQEATSHGDDRDQDHEYEREREHVHVDDDGSNEPGKVEAPEIVKSVEPETQAPTKRYSSSAIPPDSELFNTNAAHAAYSSLSSSFQHSTLDPTRAIFTSANLSVLPLPIVAANYLPPRIQLLINTLPTLDNLATQLLRIAVTSSYNKIIDLASNPETPEGAAYRDLTSLFEFTKRLYSEEDPFLTVDHLAPGMWRVGDVTPQIFKSKEQSIESTLRKVNLATFLAATLGTMEIGFFYLNEFYLEIFCPGNSLDVKNSLSDTNYMESAPSSLATSIQSGTGSTVGGRIGKLLKPQALLFLDLKTQAYISAIEAGERSKEDILDDILPDNMEQILLERRNISMLLPTEVDFVERCRSRKAFLLKYDESNLQPLSENFKWFTFLKDLFDYTSRNMGYLIWGKSGKPPRDRREETPAHTQELYDQINAQMNYSPSSRADDDAAGGDSSTTDHSNLLPSEIREKQIQVNGHRPSQRRPWTREEEKAFKHAMELKGPHWSAILDLFGKGGKINESLRNRSQVQLKDKARNWKVFYLKNDMEVPHYLRNVTGGLDDKVKRSISRTSAKTAAAPVPNAQQQKQKQQEQQ
ncbi:uncharacterized protein LODBEIA_P43510 [Lodderomyces beijingensis]|uniref:HTH myb-type domain-containing protein n=1 Tax=Lodderomyces beijingensis TaxID=1775926 RepID=A0ABP0ZUY7_9ASCO